MEPSGTQSRWSGQPNKHSHQRPPLAAVFLTQILPFFLASASAPSARCVGSTRSSLMAAAPRSDLDYVRGIPIRSDNRNRPARCGAGLRLRGRGRGRAELKGSECIILSPNVIRDAGWQLQCPAASLLRLTSLDIRTLFLFFQGVPRVFLQREGLLRSLSIECLELYLLPPSLPALKEFGLGLLWVCLPFRSQSCELA